MRKFFTTIFLVFSILCFGFADSPITIQESFTWSSSPLLFEVGDDTYELWKFEGAVINDEHPSLPYFMKQFPVEGPGELVVEILNANYESFERLPSPDDEILRENLVFQTAIHREGNRYYGHIAFVPFIKSGSSYQRLLDVELRISLQPGQITFRDPENADNSVLRDGDIYKIAVNQSGVHKITYDFLKNDLEIDIDNVPPNQIKLYGNIGGVLPEDVDTERTDDLAENHIQIVGGEDGQFNSGDYILFYAHGPDRWIYDTESGIFNMQKNIYDFNNYYFIKISPESGQRMQSNASLGSADYTSTSYNDFARLENEKVNLFYDWSSTEGSGQRWYGDHFKVTRTYNYDNLFEFPNLRTDVPANLKVHMVLRYDENPGSKFNIKVNGGNLINSSNANDIGSYSSSVNNYAYPASIDTDINLSSGNIDLEVNYPHPGGNGDGSEGWLDYIQFNVRQNLVMEGAQITFRDTETLNYGSSTFQLSGANNNVVVWDITEAYVPAVQEATLNGSTLSFRTTTTELREFVAFLSNGDLPEPEAVSAIENQNLHALTDVDLVILYPLEFESEAQRLAQHRSDYSNLNVAIVRVDHLFNEFASGRTDPTAFRDFSKMLYSRNERFRYLLLFGDGSFDNRDIYELGGNYVSVFEREAYNPIFAFPADDYFAILEPPANAQEPLRGYLTISVGRLPVKSLTEAKTVVDKIIKYDTDPNTLGDWRNRLVFVGDDEDGNIHTEDADEIADKLLDSFPSLNIDKIFLDAYPQESTPGGDRFPTVTEAINQSVFKGVLSMTYLGHGGPKGWAQERVLNISDILNWENAERLPLFITATCSFTGYDDPSIVSAGEELMLSPRGGAIGLMTTTRAVYASQNAKLTDVAMQNLFERNGNAPRTLGEMIKSAKNTLTTGNITINSRKFALIGDPSQLLAIPDYNVATYQINDHIVADGEPDTLRALQKVTIKGAIVDQNGNILQDFNGEILPTVFDKSTTVTTLSQDGGSPYQFEVRKNTLFKGRASVTNGEFQFTFVVPKDINYDFGPGKISYYAFDEESMLDASGTYNNIIIGGTDPNALADDIGPEVEVFMNTEDFVFGGITSKNPTLLVKLQDDNGINIVGNSIGHDLEGVLDNNTQNTYLLNDFYESELDDYTKGVVRFPLSNLSEGRHYIKVKAWDVANNSSEGFTEFIVAADGKVALEHVLNYPNPFTDRTCFQFDHNLANQELEVQVQIFTVSGRLVKTINQFIFSDGALRRDDCIEWDGKDDFGDQLARGVYLYQVKVRATNTGDTTLNGESEFEKLVILK